MPTKKRVTAVTADDPATNRKARIDALLLALPGVVGKKINGLDAYFVGDRMFACISGAGLGLRVPMAVASNLQFSRDNVKSFQPGGMTSTREWVQIDRSDAADYAQDMDVVQTSIDFVRG